MRTWWQSLRMQYKLQILTQSVVIALMLTAQFWIMDRFERHVYEASEVRTLSIADGVINGANMLMLTGTIGDPATRKSFIDKMGATDGIADLKIIRGEKVREMFGDGLPDEQPSDELEWQVLEDGQVRFEPYEDADGTMMMRALVPFIAREEFRGTNCLSCHVNAREGDILGATSMTIDLGEEQAGLSRLNMGLWGGQFAFQAILFITIGLIGRAISRPARHMQDTMAAITDDGDLTRRVEKESNDEIGQTAESFNSLMDSFQGIIGEFSGGADEVAREAQRLTELTASVKTAAGEQSQMAGTVASAVEEIRASIATVAERTGEAAELSDAANTAAMEGRDSVNDVTRELGGIESAVTEAATVIHGLGERSERISGIVATITDIAEQTNLLALNAAIEAARAGEQGRGFAVVADEVRKLAARTAEATSEVTEVVGAVGDEVGRAVASMETVSQRADHGGEVGRRAAEALEHIAESARTTEERIAAIATAMNEQSAASEEIARNMQDIASMSENSAHEVGETSEAIHHLTDLSASLHDTVSRFKT